MHKHRLIFILLFISCVPDAMLSSIGNLFGDGYAC